MAEEMSASKQMEIYYQPPGSSIFHLPWFLFKFVFSSCHWDSFPKWVEPRTNWMWDWCCLSSFLSQTAFLHKGKSRWWVLRPPPSPVRTTFPYSKAQLECITLHPGWSSLTKHASATLVLFGKTGLEMIFTLNSPMVGLGDFKNW